MKQDEGKSIVLIGFMGVGKTTAGERAARKSNRVFVDIDLEIEKKFTLPVNEIFKKHGEQAFRSIEKQLIEEHCHQSGHVLSLGGGAFMNSDTRNTCLQHTVVIFLDITWGAWLNRYKQLIDTRPLLQQKSLQEVEQLFLERRQVYAHHHGKIMMDDLSPDEAANKIIELASSKKGAVQKVSKN
ncbi:shikimate kinase [Siminovitchia sediminis]|uniref:Shikimate kinase n=1 Tax=Siminovitchia sediminis TaxID=1274353 RepID=A0ABW4KIZ6_9BACI